MADFFVSKALDMLTAAIAGEIEQKVKLVVGVKNEVKLLTDNLQSIQAVLVDAEKRQLKEETVKLWLRRLKNISYDIDDVLDEWSFEILKSKIEGDEYEYASKSKRIKVWPFILSFCFCFREVGFRHDIAVKITELNESLDVIAKEKDKYSFSLIKRIENIERAVTTSVINIPEMKHREQDEKAVLNLLLADSSKQNPHIISVVGMGGIGKTTLAKLVYNDKQVTSHFDIKLWVCVSVPFDEIRIAKAILESLKGIAPNIVELQNIVEQIQQCIFRKKFLLVLDDVWNEDSRKWGQVEHFLKCGSIGSKILVTSRKENVARIMGCRNSIRLGLLSDEDCWSIFCEVVFSERTDDLQHNGSLVEIGRNIVNRCKGLPLAVKTIGGLLRFKDSVDEWQRVLDSDLWEIEEMERDVFAPLFLSYNDLPCSLKQCFLYCVIFPKDHVMSKEKLIEKWMSQGYLKATKSKSMEMIGDEYFQILVMRSFFQDIGKIESQYVFKMHKIDFKMHDIVHDFAQSLIENECCSIEVVNNEIGQRIIDVNPIEVRHVGITLGRYVNFPSSFYNLRRLQSLIFLSGNGTRIGVALPKIFNELTCLRSLNLSGCNIREIPSNISKLIHLRQLDVSRNKELEELPETVCKLYNLQTIDVEYCQDLRFLPEELGKLINLRCLNNDETSFSLPKGIKRLSVLQKLCMVNICNNEQVEAIFILGEIKTLNQLGGNLAIKWRRQHVDELDVEDAKQAKLKDKKNLTDVQIYFSDESYGVEWRKQQDEELLEALEPTKNVKSLTIWDYLGSNKMCGHPNWIASMTSLRKLYLGGWINCEHFPPLGKLPWLDSLRLWKFRSLKRVGVEFLGLDHLDISTAFPKLTFLHFQLIEEWEEWGDQDIDDGVKVMPSLECLTIVGCPKLKKLPNYIVQNTALEFIGDCYSLKQQLYQSNSD